MKLIYLTVLVLILCATIYEAKDLLVGDRLKQLLISTEKVVYKGIPLISRDQDYIYTDPKHRIIKAIVVRDYSRTQTVPTVTSGGVGENHVTIHFKSGQGEVINYLVMIFAENK